MYSRVYEILFLFYFIFFLQRVVTYTHADPSYNVTQETLHSQDDLIWMVLFFILMLFFFLCVFFFPFLEQKQILFFFSYSVCPVDISAIFHFFPYLFELKYVVVLRLLPKKEKRIYDWISHNHLTWTQQMDDDNIIFFFFEFTMNFRFE